MAGRAGRVAGRLGRDPGVPPGRRVLAGAVFWWAFGQGPGSAGLHFDIHDHGRCAGACDHGRREAIGWQRSKNSMFSENHRPVLSLSVEGKR